MRCRLGLNLALTAVLGAWSVIGCGGSTDTEPTEEADAAVDAKTDAKPDAKPDTGVDAQPDVAPDAKPDVPVDTGPDVVKPTCADSNPCGAHGTCDDSAGVIQCVCEPGWVGKLCTTCAAGHHSEGDACVLDQSCLPNSCDQHGTCQVVAGKVACTCNEGYSGEFCADCADGYHVEGTGCVVDQKCPQSGACNGHGVCDDGTGVVVCTCEAGWAEKFCTTCAAGYHPDGDACVLDQTCMPTTCAGHGTCTVVSGKVVCACDDGYTGDYCLQCATGYHPGVNGCVPDQACPQTGACSGHGVCDDTSGMPVCACNAGWTGETCGTCAPGFHPEGVDCVLDQTCMASSCSGHGTCSVQAGVVVCACNTGYDPASYCAGCATGYHFLGGVCVIDESCPVSGACSDHGICDDSSGQPVCSCGVGYSGVICGACAPGFQDNDHNGTCLVTCALYGVTCAHGVCSDADGTAGCTCPGGWTGADCSVCTDDGYEPNDTDSYATVLTGDFAASGLVICGTDQDWYAIGLPEGGAIDVSVTFSQAAGDIDLALWYPSDSTPSTANRVAVSQTLSDGEHISYTVPAGKAGKYYVQVKGCTGSLETPACSTPSPLVRNTYGISVDREGCETCASLGKECGTWDDGCGGTLTCGPCAPGIACDQYRGVCVENVCDLAEMGCCTGSVLHFCYEGQDYPIDCAGYGSTYQCSWTDDLVTYPGLPGFFGCFKTADSPPAGIINPCPSYF